MATANLLQTSVSGGTQNALSLQGDGVFFPKASTTSRLALTLTTTDKGFIVYDTTDNNIYFWNGAAWESVPSSGDAGANGSVQYNDNGIVSGASNFTYNKATSAVSIAGDLTVDTTTLFVNSSNDRVGIGTATPAEKLDIFSSAGTAAIKIQTAANIPFTLNSQIPGVSNDGFAIRDGTASANRLTIDSSGNVNVVGGNLVMGTAAKGIDFSINPNPAGATSELLNDYEEGTFLPTVIGTTTAGTVTYARQLGRYIKVGNLVTVQIYVSWSGGTGTGNLAFGGLPFTIANNANEYASGTIGVIDGIALTALYVPSIAGSWNTTVLNINQFPVGGGTNISVPYDADGAIIMTSTYIA